MRWFASLRRSGEIAAVRRRGRQANLSTLALYATSGGVRPQIAVTVSKAVGGAVVRNRVKRQIKGALDAMSPVTRPVRLVIVARPSAATESYGRLSAEVARAFEQLRLPR